MQAAGVGFEKYIYESNLSDYTPPVYQPKFMYSNLKSSSKTLIFKDLAEGIVTNAYCYSINRVKDFSSQFEEALSQQITVK